jgi:hypothetical protein
MRNSPAAARRPVALVSASLLAGLALAACGKAKDARDPATTIVPDGTPALDLAAKPQLIFQLFGDRDSPRMMPVAAVVNGVIKPIGLTRAGWRDLATTYMAAGTKYPFYVEGGAPGEVTIARDTAYSLPGCAAVMPMSVVALDFKKPHADPTVEFLATSGALVPPRAEPSKLMSEQEIEKLGRRLGHEVGKRVNLSPAEMDSLDFHARLIWTGASKAPTVLISFIDPNAGESHGGPWTGHVFALADSGANGYEVTYAHAVKGDAKAVEFQRLMNHVDVNGDGTDEIILGAWKYASDNDLVVLSFKAGRWQEVLRVKQNWCLDSRPEK